MRGSFVCGGWASWNVEQRWTASTSSECIPGQYMTSLTVSVVCSIPMREAWALVSISCLMEVGMTIRIPLNTSPLLAISSSLYGQYGRRTRDDFILSSGQPVWIAFVKVCSVISVAVLRLICPSL